MSFSTEIHTFLNGILLNFSLGNYFISLRIKNEGLEPFFVPGLYKSWLFPSYSTVQKSSAPVQSV